MLAKPS